MTKQPDVSVIMAAWHAADFIAPAIQSVLAQDGVSLELIVVDDASSDATTNTALEAGQNDPRLKVERLDHNGGPSVARNWAIERATGRYIAVVDSDDSLEPGRLSRLSAFADETGADIVADNMNRVDTLGAPGSQGAPFLSIDALDQPKVITLADYLDPATEGLFGENLGYLKPLFRAKTLRRLGALYDTSLRNSEDFYLVAGLLAEGADMRLHPSRGYNYLVRPGSISHRLTPALTAAIVNADGVFAQKYARVFDTRCAVAHAKRSAGLRNMHSFERVVQAVKARKPTAILTALVERPAAMPHVASRLAGIAAAKFRRNEAS